MSEADRDRIQADCREAQAALEQLAGANHAARLDSSDVQNGDAQELAALAQENGAAQPAETCTADELRTLFDAMPVALAVMDRQGSIVLVSEQTERLFGYAPRELLGKPIEILLKEQLRPGEADFRFRATERRRSQRSKLEMLGRRKDGSVFPVVMSVASFATKQGALQAAVIRDVSRLRRDEAKFRTLVEHIPAITFIAPLDEAVPELYVSPQIEDLLGYTQAEWLSDPTLWYHRLHPEDRDRWNRQFAATCAGGEPFRAVYRIIAKDGRVVWVHGYADLVRGSDGKPSFLQGVAFDISPIKEAEVERDRFFLLSTDLLCVAGFDGYFKRVNPAFSRSLGFGIHELLTVPFLDFVHPDDRATVEAELHKLALGGSTSGIEIRLRCKDGSFRWLQWNAVAYLERQMIYAVGRDVSERIFNEERIGGLLESAPDPMVMVNEQGTIEMVNLQMVNAFGYSREELVGQSVDMLVPERLRARHPEHRARFFANPEVRPMGTGLELFGRRKDGSEFPVEISLSPLRTQQGMLVIAAVRDITERKRLEQHLRQVEQQLRQWNEALELRVIERTTAVEEQAQMLRTLNTALMRSNQDLDDFAYVASHDLKEPLRGICNYATFLTEDYADKIDEEGKAKLATLVRLSTHMTGLLDALLEFSRVGRLELGMGTVDLDEMVRGVVESLQFTLQESRVAVRIPTRLPEVHCDRARVGEIFRNLITNAIKYNDKNEKWVEIGFKPPAEPDEPIVFYVRDNGIGIRSIHQEAIFRIFKRLHARDKFGGGAGAGLTIAKKIVERHGGRIWLESEVGAGTTFFFTLQAAEVAEN
jgi:PAS domain S-box-containing protein